MLGLMRAGILTTSYSNMQGITTIAMGKIHQNSEENATRRTRKKTRSALNAKGLNANAMPLSNISANTTTTISLNKTEESKGPTTTTKPDHYRTQHKLSSTKLVLSEDTKDQGGGGVAPVFLENISDWDQWLCRPIYLLQSDQNFVQHVQGTTKKSFFCSLCGCQWAAHREHTKHLEGVRHKKAYNLYQGLYKFHQDDAATCAMLLNKIRKHEDVIQSLGTEAQRRDVLVNFLRGVHKEKKTIEQSWKYVEKLIQAYNKQAIVKTKTESTMNRGPSNDSTTLKTSTSLVLASETTRNDIKDKPTEIGSKSSRHNGGLLEKSSTETENNADEVMDRLDISSPKFESELQLALQDISGDYYSDDDLESPTAAMVLEEIETFGETTATTMIFSPLSQTQSDDVDPFGTCCNLSMLSEMTMKSEVNWMDTIPEFEARIMQEEADDFLLFSPVKEQQSNDLLAILAFNAVHQAKRSTMELKSNIAVLETLLQEADSLVVSPTNAMTNEVANASTLQSSDNNVCDIGETKEVGKSFSDVEDEDKSTVTGSDSSMAMMESVEKDMRFNIAEALDEIHPTSVSDTLSSRGVFEQDSGELLWIDDDLERAKDCVAALAFFGFQ